MTHTVLLELEWVLRVVNDLPRQSNRRAMAQILGLSNIHIDKAEQIARALCWYEQDMDFADALHLALAAGVERFVTFDKRFEKSATAQHLAIELL